MPFRKVNSDRISGVMPNPFTRLDSGICPTIRTAEALEKERKDQTDRAEQVRDGNKDASS